MALAKYLDAVDGVATQFTALVTSVGASDANKIVQTDVDGQLSESLIPTDMRGEQGPQGEQGLQGIQGPIGPQGVPGTGFSQINTPLIPINSSYELDELDTSLYSSCLWIVTAIDPLSNLYRTGVINATRNSWSHYAIVGDVVLYRLTVDNLVLSVTNNHANPITLSVIRLPTTKP